MKTLNGMIASQDTKRQMLINISVFCSNYFGNEINVGDINKQLAEEGEPPIDRRRDSTSQTKLKQQNQARRD